VTTEHKLNNITAVLIRKSLGGSFSFCFQPWSSLQKCIQNINMITRLPVY